MSANVEILLKATDSASSEIKATAKSLGDLDDAGERSGGKFSRLGDVLSGVGRVAFGALAAGAALAGVAFTQSITQASDFQSSLNMLQAVSGATDSQMRAISDTAKALGADMSLPATSAVDAAKAMTELAKAGLSVDQTMAAAKGTLQLAAAGALSEAEAAQIAANALNAFKLGGDKAVMVADLLAAAANSSSGEVKDMADSLQMVGSVAQMSGQSINDTVTAISLMANAGIKGSDAGTSLKQMLLSLQSPSKKAAELMDGLGISLYDAHGNMLPMRDLVGQFTGKLQGMTMEQRNAALATIFGSDAVRAANIVLYGGVEAWDSMSAAVNRGGAASELAGARMRGLGGAFEGFKSQLETVLLAMGEPFLGVLENLLRGLAAFVAAATPQLTQFATEVAAAFTALATWLTTQLPAMLATLQALFNGSLVTMATDATTQTGSILMAFQNLWVGLQTIFQTGVAVVQGIMAAYAPYIQAVFAQVSLFAQTHGAEIVAFLQTAWNMIVGIITTALQLIQAIVVPVFTALTQFINQHGTEIQAILSVAWEAIKTIITVALTLIQGILQGALALINGDWKAAWEIQRTVTEAIWNAIQGFITTVANAIGVFISAWLAQVQTSWNTIWSAIGQFLRALLAQLSDYIQQRWNAIYTFLVTALTAIYNAFNAVWNTIKTLVFTVTNAIWQALQSVWAQITAWMTQTLENIRTIFVDTWERVRLAVVDALNAIWTAIRTTLERCVQGIIGFVGQFVEAGKAIVRGAEQGVWDAANALLNAVVDAMRRALEAAKRALGIGSPSRVFAQGVGEPIMQGVGVGIEAGAPAVEQTLAGKMAELVDVAIGGAEGIAAGIGDIFGGIDLPSLGFGGGTGLSKELKALVDKAPGLLDLARELNSVGGNMQSLDIGALMWMNNMGVTESQIQAIADWVKNGMPQGLGGELGSSLFGGLGDESKKLLEEIKTTLGEMRDMMKEMLGQMRDGMRFYFDDMMRIQITRLDTMRQKFVEFSDDMVGMAAWTGGKVSEGIAGAWAAMAAPAPAYVTPTPNPSLWEGGRRGEGSGQTVNINATVRDDQDAELLARRVAVILQTR